MPGHGTPMSGGSWPVRGERPVSQATKQMNETIEYLEYLDRLEVEKAEKEKAKKAEKKKTPQPAQKTSLWDRYGPHAQ